MNKRYFLAVMSIRNHANKLDKRVRSVDMLDETGLIYQVNYWDGDWQCFRLGMNTLEIVYMTDINQPIKSA